MSARAWALCIALSAPQAVAEVVGSGENGFEVHNAAVIMAPPDRVYEAMTEIGRWWDPAHSWSGDGANLSLEARPGGCFCEHLPGGGVVHATIVYAAPGKTLRLQGALGPLQASGLAGSLTWNLVPAEPGTRVEQTYSIGGYRVGGLLDLAPVVDGVMAGQLARLKRYVETGTAQ